MLSRFTFRVCSFVVLTADKLPFSYVGFFESAINCRRVQKESNDLAINSTCKSDIHETPDSFMNFFIGTNR